MGATTFEVIGIGADIQAAFTRLRDQALWESGHGGYTGTIAEKRGFAEFTLPTRWTFEKFVATVGEAAIVRWDEPSPQGRRRNAAERLLSDRVGPSQAGLLIETYCDKWGPAIGVRLGQAESKLILQRFGVSPATSKVYGFFGWASC